MSSLVIDSPAVAPEREAAEHEGPARDIHPPARRRPVQRRAAAPTGGQTLAPPLQRAAEARLGASMGNVRVVPAAGECAAMGARAFTRGDGAGEHVVGLANDVELDTEDGQFTLFHELAHVAQQRRGQADALDGLDGDPGCRESLERAADAAAAECLRGGDRR